MIKNTINNFSLGKSVYIGDTQSDYQASLEASVDFIHAEYGFGTVAGECRKAKSFKGIVNQLMERGGIE